MSFLDILKSNPQANALLDAMAPKATPRLDGVDPAEVAGDATGYALQRVAVEAVSAVQTWCETDDLDDGEGSGDRLIALLVGIADENKDGELTPDEQAIVQVAMTAAWDYMAAKGVTESDLDTLFNGEDPEAYNAAGARVCEFLKDSLPDGDDASGEEMDDFAFGVDGQAPVFDGVATLDAVYKKRFAIRQGKKVIVRKRVAGTIRLSAKQKVAIKKASRRAHGAAATARRMKSMRISRRMGLSGRR